MRRRPQRTQAVRKVTVLLADRGCALWWGEVRHLFGREIVLKLYIGLLRHLPHKRVHLILRRRHGRRRAHRVLHVRRLDVQI